MVVGGFSRDRGILVGGVGEYVAGSRPLEFAGLVKVLAPPFGGIVLHLSKYRIPIRMRIHIVVAS